MDYYIFEEDIIFILSRAESMQNRTFWKQYTVIKAVTETFTVYTAQKMKFSIKYFFSKCDQVCRRLPIWSHLLKKSLMENSIFCAVIMNC